MANSELTTTAITAKNTSANTNKIKLQDSKSGVDNGRANVTSDMKCVKYVQVKMKELPTSLNESQDTL